MNPASNWYEQSNFWPDCVVLIRNKLRDELGSKFKAYWDGTPDPLSKSWMPAVCVSETKMTFDFSATGTDDNTHSILIRVIYNKRDDYGATLIEPNVDLTERKLRLDVMGRDPVTRQYLPNTILGVLRPNVTLGNWVIGNHGSVEWGVMDKADEAGLETAEAHIQLTVIERQEVPIRS